MMDAVEQGNTERALSDWRQLHQRMDFRRKQLGESLESSLSSAAITRTVVRIAAMRTRIPPVVIDQITEEVSRRNAKEASSAGIEANTEYLIRFLCGEIRKRRRENVSYLTASVSKILFRVALFGKKYPWLMWRGKWACRKAISSRVFTCPKPPNCWPEAEKRYRKLPRILAFPTRTTL